MAANRANIPKIRIAWWLRLVQSLLVRYVRVDDGWVEKVRDTAKRGPIFFVLRSRSLIDFLCLQGLCKKHGLPEVSFVTGLASFSYLPFFFWFISKFRRSTHDTRRQRFVDTFKSGKSAVVFLRRPAVRGALGSSPVLVDGIELAVEAQAMLNIRVQALPTVFLWGESAMKRLPGTMDFIFGSNEYPRLLLSIWLLLRRRSVHELTVSDPLDLEAIRSERHIEGRALTGVVRTGVWRQIELIRRARLGALTKPSSRVMTEVLMSGRLRNQLKVIAENSGIPSAEVLPRARALLKKMAADFSPRIIGLFAVIMIFVSRRIYTGIDVRKEDIDRLRKAVAKSATLLLPSHKSHMDYIVLSHLMRENNLMLPHIVAGQNLSFWPLGWLFRSSGAFFIRRSFINDRFYTAVVSAYVRRLVQEEYALEVFIEGGRSRTGKLLRPRTGMLDMALKAIAVSPRVNLTLLPVFIGYEHVIEEQSYVAESKGRPKKAENIKGLLSSTKVLFSRYGRVYVRSGEPFSIDDVLKQRGLSRDDLLVDSLRRTFTIEVGERTLAEINQIALATPTSVLATVLLSANRGQISYEALSARCLWLADFMERSGASLSPILEKWRTEGADEKNGLLYRSVRAHVKSGRIAVSEARGERRYSIRDGQRMALDYYKNNIIHFLVPASLVANILLTAGGKRVEMAHVLSQLAIGCLLYRDEFIIPEFVTGSIKSARCAEHLSDQAMEILSKMGVVDVMENRVSIIDGESAEFLSNAMRNYHEVYFAAIEAVRTKIQQDKKEQAAKIAQEISDRHLASKRFTKPEGHSKLNQTSAMNTLKELKVSRPAQGETPFALDGIGTTLHQYLASAIGWEADTE